MTVGSFHQGDTFCPKKKKYLQERLLTARFVDYLELSGYCFRKQLLWCCCVGFKLKFLFSFPHLHVLSSQTKIHFTSIILGSELKFQQQTFWKTRGCKQVWILWMSSDVLCEQEVLVARAAWLSMMEICQKYKHGQAVNTAVIRFNIQLFRNVQPPRKQKVVTSISCLFHSF